ncbi:MAG: hypothetical protein MZV63_34035 [Marinilabiliales bacterium]|nr:hypothetical protein [Marinilabiliales bacterium]
MLVISYSSPSIENVLSVIVFDANGYQVRALAENTNTGYEGNIHVGRHSRRRIASPHRNLYLWVSAFDTFGNANRWKKACASYKVGHRYGTGSWVLVTGY